MTSSLPGSGSTDGTRINPTGEKTASAAAACGANRAGEDETGGVDDGRVEMIRNDGNGHNNASSSNKDGNMKEEKGGVDDAEESRKGIDGDVVEETVEQEHSNPPPPPQKEEGSEGPDGNTKKDDDKPASLPVKQPPPFVATPSQQKQGGGGGGGGGGGSDRVTLDKPPHRAPLNEATTTTSGEAATEATGMAEEGPPTPSSPPLTAGAAAGTKEGTASTSKLPASVTTDAVVDGSKNPQLAAARNSNITSGGASSGTQYQHHLTGTIAGSPGGAGSGATWPQQQQQSRLLSPKKPPGLKLPQQHQQQIAPTVTALASIPPAAGSAAASLTMVDPEDPYAAIRLARNPLTELYGPFIVDSDTCLDDARRRLKIALQQVLQLRKAFTERVYTKYRVCLIPPEVALSETTDLVDPAIRYDQLQQETIALKEEKEIERKQAAKINAEVASSATAATATTSTPGAAPPSAASVMSSLFDANTTSADQIMYYSAGLHLVILPEDDRVDPAWLTDYKIGRCPNDASSATGGKQLSHAAITAGETMLDRARKAAAMRIERQRRRQLQLLQQQSPSSRGAVPAAAAVAAPGTMALSTGHVLSRLSSAPLVAGATSSTIAAAAAVAAAKTQTTAPTLPSTAGQSTMAVLTSATSGVQAAAATAAASTTTSTKKRSRSTDKATGTNSTTSGKGKSRGQSVLSTSTLLSVAPTSDQIILPNSATPAVVPTDAMLGTAAPALRASTAALLDKSKNVSRTTQQRLQHPHPESLGGRRRANNNALATGEPFLQAYLALTLPPLPGAKERLERKPLQVCSDIEDAVTDSAKVALQTVLKQFTDKKNGESCQVSRPATKIRLLNGFRNAESRRFTKQGPAEISSTTQEGVQAPAACAESSYPPIDPVVAFSVLHAVGLVSQSKSVPGFAMPELPPDCPVWSDELRELREKIVGNKALLTDSILRLPPKNDTDSTSEVEPPAKRPCTVDAQRHSTEGEDEPKIPAQTIRGGGDALLDSSNDGTDNAPAGKERNDGDKNKNAATSVAATSSSRQSAAMPPAAGSSASAPAPFTSAVAAAGASSKNNGKRKYSDPVHHQSSAEQQTARRRKYSDPGLTTQGRMPPPAMMASQMAMPSNNQGSALGALYLANHLRNVRHPAGELAGYMGSLQQPARFDMASLYQGGQAAAQFQSLGLMQQGAGLLNYDAAAARAALYIREQQAAAALFSSGGYSQAGQFPAGAVSALSLAMNPQYAMPSTNLGGPMHPPAAFSGNGMIPAPMPSTYMNRSEEKQDTSSKEEGRTPAPKKRSASSSERTVEVGEKAAEKPSSNQTPSLKSPPGITSQVGAGAGAEAKPPARQEGEKSNPSEIVSKPESAAEGTGMKFFVPTRPPALSPNKADLIVKGKFGEAVADISDTATKSAAVDFLASVGAAVPIPKALLLSLLKEKLSTPGTKTSSSSSSLNIPRDLVAATILVWLWAHHEDNFQQAFEISGRTDVDPDCKWLIQAAAETAVRALTLDIAESLARGEGPFAEASRKGHGGLKGSPTSEVEFAKKLEFRAAIVVSKALAAEFQIDGSVDRVIPQFQNLVEFLDEARLCALRAKAQERTLLANLIARRATMTESFSHAYTSSTVRAGEALGHDNLFDIVQDEDVPVSSMMPHDIIAGDEEQWEDPCKPEGGFTPGLAGDDLMRRAHARAMIQKSLRKAQDRNHIRGGTSTYGPYVDPSHSSEPVSKSKSGSKTPTGGMSPRPKLKRRGSSSMLDSQVPAGTGSARAKSWAVYDPNHAARPLEWKADHSENTPYGLHRVGEKVRSLSVSLSARSGEPRSIKKAKKAISAATTQTSVSLASQKSSSDPGGELRVPKSSREIDWADIAGIFQSVEVPRKSPPTKTSDKGQPGKSSKGHGPSSSGVAGRTIFAPYCKKIDPDAIIAAGEEDEEPETEEEDVSDETVLARHQVVLDKMKAKLALFLEARKREQERRKSTKK